MTEYDKKAKKNLADAEAEDMAAEAEDLKSMMPPKVSVTIEVGDSERSGEYVCPDCGKAAVKK